LYSGREGGKKRIATPWARRKSAKTADRKVAPPVYLHEERPLESKERLERAHELLRLKVSRLGPQYLTPPHQLPHCQDLAASELGEVHGPHGLRDQPPELIDDPRMPPPVVVPVFSK